MKGFVNIQRLLADHWVWRNSILGHHWVDLIMFAEYEEKTVYFGGQQVLLKRGQQVTTTRLLMARWNTNPKMVLKTLEIFEKEDMIKCVKNNRMTIITLSNYDKHQSALAAILGPNTDDYLGAFSSNNQSKRKRIGKQTKEYNNTTKQEDKKNIVVDDAERQRIVSEVFLNKDKVIEGCELFDITEEIYKKLVEDVVKDWKFTNEDEWTIEHLRNSIRVKLNYNKQNKRNGENTKKIKRDDERTGTGQDASGDPLERVTIRSSKKRTNIS